MIPAIFKNLMIQMMIFVFSRNNQNNNVFRNDLDNFIGMYDPPDVEPDNISEYNSHNYFAIGVFEDKENINILSTTNTADEKFEVISETTHGGQNNESTILGSGLIFETTYLLVRKCHEFHGSK